MTQYVFLNTNLAANLRTVVKRQRSIVVTSYDLLDHFLTNSTTVLYCLSDDGRYVYFLTTDEDGKEYQIFRCFLDLWNNLQQQTNKESWKAGF